MPYVESICKAGNTIEIERYYTARYGIRGIRGKRINPTPEEMQKINSRNAEKKLRRLINANFGYGDYHLVLTYARARGEPHRPRDKMREDAAKFLRQLRKEYKKRGRELKYILVMEIGQRGARHLHLVINEIEPGAVQSCWEHGRININPLDASGDYSKLASYLIKYSDRMLREEGALQGKRWRASRNLIHPKPVVKIISSRQWFRNEAKVPHRYKGKYDIDLNSVQIGVHSPEFGGYGYMRFTLIKRRC